MATYTQADVDAVKAAILALAKGERLVSIQLGDHTEQYGQAQLPELERLLAAMQADVAASTGTARPRQYVAVDARIF